MRDGGLVQPEVVGDLGDAGAATTRHWSSMVASKNDVFQDHPRGRADRTLAVAAGGEDLREGYGAATMRPSDSTRPTSRPNTTTLRARTGPSGSSRWTPEALDGMCGVAASPAVQRRRWISGHANRPEAAATVGDTYVDRSHYCGRSPARLML
jgi:hypothetical protein